MADKTKTIKNASDQELDALILRLRKENDAQQLVRNLKSGSNPPGNYMNPVDLSVSTETPIEDLYHEEIDNVLAHFGVPGMKWGHRKGSSSTNVYEHRQNMMKKALKIAGTGGIHHLVAKGVKSGQNKTNEVKDKISSKKQENENKYSEEYKQSRQIKTKSYKEMSNKELKALNERMQLERNLRDLKSSDVQKGLDVVKTLTAAGTTVASLYAISKTPLGQAVKKAITHK